VGHLVSNNQLIPREHLGPVALDVPGVAAAKEVTMIASLTEPRFWCSGLSYLGLQPGIATSKELSDTLPVSNQLQWQGMCGDLYGQRRATCLWSSRASVLQTAIGKRVRACIQKVYNNPGSTLGCQALNLLYSHIGGNRRALPRCIGCVGATFGEEFVLMPSDWRRRY
jgi:hypothetical protein